MSKYTKLDIKVPDINRTFVSGAYNYSKPETVVANNAMMNKIYKDYGKFINRWGIEFEVDDSILVGFIATESGGVNAPPNSFGATIIMMAFLNFRGYHTAALAATDKPPKDKIFFWVNRGFSS